MRAPASPNSAVQTLVVGPARQPLADLLLDVVTPMFGGGAQTRLSDQDLPIRPAAVRGNLRFWWRACNARAYKTPEDLFKAEAFFWGATSEKGIEHLGPGAIAVAVELISVGSPTFSYHDDSKSWHNGKDHTRIGPAYALFPFQGDDKNPRVPGREGVRFRLTLTLAPHVTTPDDIEQCVKAAKQALWAWIVFGGVGARTRRGCGTLWCRGDAQTGLRIPAASFKPGTDVARWLRDTAAAFVCAGDGCPMVTALAAVPTRVYGDAASGGTFAVGAATQHPIVAWRGAVQAMFTYRQDPKIRRNPVTDETTRWPEAGSVRALMHLSGGTNPVTRNSAEQGFPRADLGYPIVFQQMVPEGQDSPTLEGGQAKAQRFASPIVLKALPVSATDAYRLAVLLDAPHVWELKTPGVQLKNPRPATALMTGQLDGHGQAWRPDAPLMGTHRSARSAFMDFIAGSPAPVNAAGGWKRPWSKLT